jgi:hypothetical protein
LAYGGKLVARPERPRGNPALHLIDNLPLNRYATLGIEGEPERCWRIGARFVHLGYECTSVL